MRFENKVGIVTGSGGGIGQAYAEALAREGAAVVVADINVEAADAVAKQIVADGGTAISIPVDVSDPFATQDELGAGVPEQVGALHLARVRCHRHEGHTRLQAPDDRDDRLQSRRGVHADHAGTGHPGRHRGGRLVQLFAGQRPSRHGDGAVQVRTEQHSGSLAEVTGSRHSPAAPG